MRTLLTAIFFLSIAGLSATHIRGGYITAKRIDNLTLTYEITFVGIRDTDSGIQFGVGIFDLGTDNVQIFPNPDYGNGININIHHDIWTVKSATFYTPDGNFLLHGELSDTFTYLTLTEDIGPGMYYIGFSSVDGRYLESRKIIKC